MPSKRISAGGSPSAPPDASDFTDSAPPGNAEVARVHKKPRISASPADPNLLLVSMKLIRRQNGFPGGASAVSVKMADRNQIKFGENGNPKAKENASIASLDTAEKLWMHRRPDGTAEAANGKFTFATMLDGSIRLGEQGNGTNAHAALTGGSKNVSFAGEVEFEKGKIKTYSNGSGTYLPPAVLRHQSGFNQAAGFQDVGNPPAILKGAQKENAIAAAEQAIAKKLKELE